jgi:hypothetical protein
MSPQIVPDPDLRPNRSEDIMRGPAGEDIRLLGRIWRHARHRKVPTCSIRERIRQTSIGSTGRRQPARRG